MTDEPGKNIAAPFELSTEIEPNVWIGQDLVICDIQQDSEHHEIYYGTVALSAPDLGSGIELLPALCAHNNHAREYGQPYVFNQIFALTVRSRLMQAGIAAFVTDVAQTGADSINLTVTITTHLPLCNMPEEMPVGRLYRLVKQVTGRTLNELTKQISPSAITGTEIEQNPDLVYLPIVSYYRIDASVIDVQRVLAAKDREELDLALGLKPYTIEELQAAPWNEPMVATDTQTRDVVAQKPQPYMFVIAETVPVSVPADKLLLVQTRLHPGESVHMPSNVIDPNFKNAIRLEFILLSGEIPTHVAVAVHSV